MTRDDYTSLAFHDLISKTSHGGRVVITGDYGAGKSMTLRAVFDELASRFVRKKQFQFPVAINLRNHQRQINPVEVLERHARDIGYSYPAHLVRAWRAGFIHLLLDGFDELGTPGWRTKGKRWSGLRSEAMAVIRTFIDQSPSECGIVLAGRQHYFDSQREMKAALGVRSSFDIVTLNEFNEGQAKQFLKSLNFTGELPVWVPTRPLLLGCLCTSGILQEAAQIDEEISIGEGWDLLLDRICQREVKQDHSMDASMVRQVIERIATKVRLKAARLGPVTKEDLTDAYEEVCGWRPEDDGVAFLQRLPGLAPDAEESSSRVFVDPDYVDVLQAGDVYQFVVDPYNAEIPDVCDWQASLERTGVIMLSQRFRAGKISEKQASNALEVAAAEDGYGMLAADVARGMLSMDLNYVGKTTTIREAIIPEINFVDTSADMGRLTFADGIVGSIELPDVKEKVKCPVFSHCEVGTIVGWISRDRLGSVNIQDNCEVGDVSGPEMSTSGLRRLDVPTPVKVCLTILKKIFLQPGSGRKESALSRGLNHREAEYVDEILGILHESGYIYDTRISRERIWHPVRSKGAEVKKVMANPDWSKVSVLRKAASA